MENEYPSLTERVQSLFIDTMVLIITMVILSQLLDNFDNVPNWVRGTLFVLAFVLYEPLCLTLGCTLGNYIKNIRVKQFNDETKRLNFFQAIIRYVVKLLLGWLSFITIHSNPKKRAIHDIASGSVMIRKPALIQTPVYP
jgi:uncharacterized RDD family membrane protein YckC